MNPQVTTTQNEYRHGQDVSRAISDVLSCRRAAGLMDRLQEEIDADGDDAWNLLVDSRDCLTALRTVGDRMVAALRSGSDCGWDNALERWQEVGDTTAALLVQLQHEIDVDGDEPWDLLADTRAEFIRVCAAGDRVAAALRSGSDCSWDNAIAAWTGSAPVADVRFTEQSLLADVVEKWGPYGAHAELCRWMIEEIIRLRGQVGRLQACTGSDGSPATAV